MKEIGRAVEWAVTYCDSNEINDMEGKDRKRSSKIASINPNL
jgi:hypothetical protein